MAMPVTPPPRVLLVMPEQWPRALLRGALREIGYDAVGTRSLESAATIPVAEPGRGPIGLLVVTQDALGKGSMPHVDALLERHGGPPTLFVAHAARPVDERRWSRVVRRPVSVEDLVREVARLLPLSADRLVD
jgi:hypothetical protein